MCKYYYEHKCLAIDIIEYVFATKKKLKTIIVLIAINTVIYSAFMYLLNKLVLHISTYQLPNILIISLIASFTLVLVLFFTQISSNDVFLRCLFCDEEIYFLNREKSISIKYQELKAIYSTPNSYFLVYTFQGKESVLPLNKNEMTKELADYIESVFYDRITRFKEIHLFMLIKKFIFKTKKLNLILILFDIFVVLGLIVVFVFSNKLMTTNDFTINPGMVGLLILIIFADYIFLLYACINSLTGQNYKKYVYIICGCLIASLFLFSIITVTF